MANKAITRALTNVNTTAMADTLEDIKEQVNTTAAALNKLHEGMKKLKKRKHCRAFELENKGENDPPKQCEDDTNKDERAPDTDEETAEAGDE